MRSDTPEDTLQVTFRGNVIYVQGDIHCSCGVLEAWVDGAVVQERDMYHPKQWDNACQCTAVWVTGLADGEHRLEVRVTGPQEPGKRGCGHCARPRGLLCRTGRGAAEPQRLNTLFRGRLSRCFSLLPESSGRESCSPSNS